MAVFQGKARTKPTVSNIKKKRGKKLFELGSYPTLTAIGKRKLARSRIKGGSIKLRLRSAEIANIYDSKNKKYLKANIIRVVENPANKHYVRKNVLTKGTVIETDKGRARITNQPGQEGSVNALLVQ